jgi:hypothetical protein
MTSMLMLGTGGAPKSIALVVSIVWVTRDRDSDSAPV